MSEFRTASLGEAWLELVHATVTAGSRLRTEGLELLCVAVRFPVPAGSDPLIDRFGDRALVAEMAKVFFSAEPNALGHSYAALMQGPGGRNDLQDIVELLRADPATKRAVVTLRGEPGGRVPCVNIIQFLLREGALQTVYFARGQDAFRKFYADALCLAAMARTVAAPLALPLGEMTGFIGSCHVYDRDLPAIRQFVAQARPAAPAASPEGGR